MPLLRLSARAQESCKQLSRRRIIKVLRHGALKGWRRLSWGRLLKRAGLLHGLEGRADSSNVARRSINNWTRGETVSDLNRVGRTRKAVAMLSSGSVRGNNRAIKSRLDDVGGGSRLGKGRGTRNSCARLSTGTNGRLAGTDEPCVGTIGLWNSGTVIRCIEAGGFGRKNTRVVLGESQRNLRSTGSGLGSLEGGILCLGIAVLDTSMDDACTQIGNIAKQQLSHSITGLPGVVGRHIVNAFTICDGVGVQPVLVNDWTLILTEGGLTRNSGFLRLVLFTGPHGVSQALLDASGRAQGVRLVSNRARSVGIRSDGSDGDVLRLLHGSRRLPVSRSLCGSGDRRISGCPSSLRTRRLSLIDVGSRNTSRLGSASSDADWSMRSSRDRLDTGGTTRSMARVRRRRHGADGVRCRARLGADRLARGHGVRGGLSGLGGIRHTTSRGCRGSRGNRAKAGGSTPTRVAQTRLGAVVLLVDIHRVTAVLRSSRRAGMTSVSMAGTKEVSRGLRGQFGTPFASGAASGVGRAVTGSAGETTATSVTGKIVGDGCIHVHRMVVAAGAVCGVRTTTASSATATSTALIPQVALANLLLELKSRAHITPAVVHLESWAGMVWVARL